ncbi:murein biosynthesis integral membrane protein MurJ [Maridesulfovibrio hydrothermalis]|uniref:Probable lipid II flippase MurJ n=1 Tax=Maridesulfovibrio hydrothermalis AM13 = DSM 14728 TaxID=1121451 RepID=L0R9T0_9BACT|nr:murein biosynthesis integral membrane protein MurJ [Maridesulfovibrio hydrothermalis]CCO22967.1 Integral membrane protein MviN [Maridesulfovibrio hydrothermalis AM13 = DSM 14728]
MTAETGKIVRNASVVAGATLLSRILGFVRDLIVAFALGAGMPADAFFVAFRIPNLLRRLFGEGSLTMAFVPVFSRVRREQGEEAAFEMARSALVWLLIVLGGITLLAVVFAKPLVLMIAPGFDRNPELMSLTVELVRLCFPYVIFICGVALCMGILNSMGHFLAPALAPCALNVALIGSALVGYFTGNSVALFMAWGVLIGGVLQWMLQQPYLKRLGLNWRGRHSLDNPGVKRMGSLMLPTVLGAAVYQINVALGTLLASFLPVGSVSYLYYSDRLVQFPLGIFGIAVGTAALPSLSALWVEGKQREFADTLKQTVGLTLFISLPAMAGLISLAHPLIELLFERGAFDAGAVTATAQALMAYGVGLPFIAMSRPLVSAFYAQEDTKTPVKVAILCLIVNVGAGYFLMQHIAHVGLALAVSISSMLNCLLLATIVWFRTKVSPLPCLSVFKSLFLSALIGAGAWYTSAYDILWFVLIPVWIVIYAAGSLVLKSDDARMLMGALRRGKG